ncbi:MAG TPA: divalent-cation tolerance protein CutA [Pirellulaceae bacterium]|nr:divalent-cation tolerance protein CutA [Pirellulaceae bacterium]HMO91123.1 divalent-cation tolerance protein CutA [Pirellulaceae bacterium]HMP71063.1 divalent-cation tolerance protein CutA [Pirellulaceae bacterium]
MTEAIVVITTCDERDVLEKITHQLVQRKLAACCQIMGPIISTYRWKEIVEHAEEWMCTIKTTREAYSMVEALILELHAYEQPEIIAHEICCGSPGYLAWLNDQVEGVRQ